MSISCFQGVHIPLYRQTVKKTTKIGVGITRVQLLLTLTGNVVTLQSREQRNRENTNKS